MELETDIELLNKKCEDKDAEITSDKDKIKKLEITNSDYLSLNNQLESSHRVVVKELEEKLTNLDKDNAVLQTKIESAKDEVVGYKNKIKELEQTNNAIVLEKARLEFKVENLESKLLSKDNDIEKESKKSD